MVTEIATTLPNFVVIGAMRSGSTSLYKHLQAHPDVYMPRKEIHFFDQRWDRGLDWYRSRFEGWDGQPAVGEATPTYLSDPVALDRMAGIIPDARLLAILRDPVDRAYSHYWMERARDRETRSFEQAVADELSGRVTSGRSAYLGRGRYVPQLAAVCERFPRDRLEVVLFDDLRDRPGSTYAGLCRFLAIDDGFEPPRLEDRVNRFVTFRSKRIRGIRRRLPDTLHIGRIVRKLNAIEGEYPPMAPATRAELHRHFEADNAALAEWLGRDLPGWAEDAGVIPEHRDAYRLARAAGELLLRIRAQAGSYADVGLEADRRSHELLVGRIETLYPCDAVLSEESAEDGRRFDCERVWIVDPLDGTLEYSVPGRTDWAVHVALVNAGLPAAAAVALPAMGRVFSTARPAVVPDRVQPKVRVVVSRSRPPAIAVPVAEALDADVVAMGSAGAKAMAVLSGDADVYIHDGGQYEWDNAAPVGVAVAAGLHASRLDGTPLVYNNPSPWSPEILICRPELADTVLRTVERVRAGAADQPELQKGIPLS